MTNWALFFLVFLNTTIKRVRQNDNVNWMSKFLTTTTVRIPFSQLLSLFKESVAWWGVFPRVFIFHNSYNYIWSLCLKIQLKRNMMQFYIIIQCKARFSPKLFYRKKLNYFTFYLNHNFTSFCQTLFNSFEF